MHRVFSVNVDHLILTKRIRKEVKHWIFYYFINKNISCVSIIHDNPLIENREWLPNLLIVHLDLLIYSIKIVYALMRNSNGY